MKFQRKENTDTGETFTEVDCHSEIAKKVMYDHFKTLENAARYEELTMSDGRICISVKDRYNKIIVQLKEIKP